MTPKVLDLIARNTSQSNDLFGFCNFHVSPCLSSAAISPHGCSCFLRETAPPLLTFPSEQTAAAGGCGTQRAGSICTGLVKAGVGCVFNGEKQHIITLLTEEQTGVSAAIPFLRAGLQQESRLSTARNSHINRCTASWSGFFLPPSPSCCIRVPQACCEPALTL